jgi:hypothetical protein
VFPKRLEDSHSENGHSVRRTRAGASRKVVASVEAQ